jgi:hypothetical protein
VARPAARQMSFADLELLRQGVRLEPMLQGSVILSIGSRRWSSGCGAIWCAALDSRNHGRRGLTAPQLLRALVLMRLKMSPTGSLHRQGPQVAAGRIRRPTAPSTAACWQSFARSWARAWATADDTGPEDLKGLRSHISINKAPIWSGVVFQDKHCHGVQIADRMPITILLRRAVGPWMCGERTSDSYPHCTAICTHPRGGTDAGATGKTMRKIEPGDTLGDTVKVPP